MNNNCFFFIITDNFDRSLYRRGGGDLRIFFFFFRTLLQLLPIPRGFCTPGDKIVNASPGNVQAVFRSICVIRAT